MATPMLVDPGSSSGCSQIYSSEEIAVKPIAQVGQAIAIIDKVRDFTISWNKHQCKSVADRYNAIRERFRSMGWDRNLHIGEACNGGPKYDELVKILKKGKALISSYAGSNGITSTVLSRTDNRGAFQEHHEELDNLERGLGFQTLGDAVEVDESRKREQDAYLDRNDMSSVPTTDMDQLSKKLAQVVSEKAKDVDVPNLVQDYVNAPLEERGIIKSLLPSYLTIDQKSEIIKGPLIREYVRQSERDPKEQVGWAFVYSGTWLGCNFAIKVFKCGADTHWNERQLLIEVGKLVELQHPHIVRLVGFGHDDEECVFVMELMDGNLRNLINEKREPDAKPFTDSEKLDIITQIAKGMYFMHTKGCTHGDLKCSNILVKKFGESLEVKISDLRGSQSLDKAWDPEAFRQASFTRRPRWTAPEAIDHYHGVQPPTELLKQSDVYSFGMASFEVVTGKYPFDGVKEKNGPLLAQIEEGAEKWNSSSFPSEMDKDLKGLIISCWNKDPSERPSFETVCHVLDTIRSKKLAAENNTSCGVTVAGMLMQLCLDRGRRGNEPGKGELFRSKSLVRVPDHLVIRPEQLVISTTPIGEGRHGRVFKATWLGCTIAVKILQLRSASTLALQREVDFLIKVSRHPCIVQMVGLSLNLEGEHSIVMEYMDSNLRQLIQTRLRDASRTIRPFTVPEAMLIVTKIAWGMAYLHSRGLVHRDLNPSNVLAQDYRKTVDVKIMDFGVSYLEGRSNPPEILYYNGVGSGFYRAPEMLPLVTGEVLPAGFPAKDSKADLSALKAADVYSFAMICLGVLTGESPWSHIKLSYDYAAVRKGQYSPKWPSNPPPEVKSLIAIVERCWCMAPADRPTFIQICNDLQGIFKSSLVLNAT